jgi:hypothetical protein
MLLGITENLRPACSSKYRRRGDFEARIIWGSSSEIFILFDVFE